MIGSYATVPVPKNKEKVALEFLKEQFGRLHCEVRFGSDCGEKTIEIDLPREIKEINDKEINTKEELITLDKWLSFSGTILRRYYKRYRRHI